MRKKEDMIIPIIIRTKAKEQDRIKDKDQTSETTKKKTNENNNNKRGRKVGKGEKAHGEKDRIVTK